MHKYITLFMLLGITLFPVRAIAQKADTVNYYGNLLRVPMLAESVSPSDTLGNWEDIVYKDYPGRQYSFYYGHLNLPSRSYLLKQAESYRAYKYMDYFSGANFLETEGEKMGRKFSRTAIGMDFFPPFWINVTEVIPTSFGFWLVNGSLGNSFIDNNDSLYVLGTPLFPVYQDPSKDSLECILGWADKALVCAFRKEIYQNYEYRLVDFSMPISFNENNSRVIYFKGDPNLYKKEPVFDKIKKIRGDLYIVQSEWRAVQFYRFADTSFNFVKYQSDEPGMEAFSGPHSKWEFRNNRLYRFSGMELISYDFNLADTTITNRRVLLSSGSDLDSIGVDRNFKYAARISGDSLKIYDIDKERFVNSISISGVNRPMRPVVDSPYVYLHQTTRIITNVKKENNPSVKSYWLSAYPNPFNPVTTLQFNIPVAGQVELKVYDALGKEVTTLVNEVRKEGVYKVQFNASSLPSGIYLCRMSAGSYSVTKKVVLLK